MEDRFTATENRAHANILGTHKQQGQKSNFQTSPCCSTTYMNRLHQYLPAAIHKRNVINTT